jgi:2-polyprenyl-3-methyl-5-hydroxy-6-metoxy-1,4-benzoquinol methylase
MLALARCLGFTSQHIFGLDGNEGPSGKHAAAHPSQAKKHFTVDYDGVTYTTTPAFLECAKAVFHELDAMPDVTATFYGDGLVQHMARHYVRGAKVVPPNLAVSKPELISTALRALNARLHRDNLAYGVGGGKHAPAILNLSIALKTTSILDYGCGKGYLAKALPFPIWEYDPAIPGKDACPRPADIVVCTDVLEHVEDGKVQYVLKDISRCLRRVGYLVIHLGPASKTYADGRNTHLTQRGQTWWEGKLAKFFHVATVIRRGPELHVVIAPLGVPDPVVSPTEVAARALLPPPEPLPLLNLATVAVCHDPYVVGGATDVLAPEVYAQLTAAFPPLAIFDAGTKKRALSEVHAAEAYHAFLAQTPIWARFHAMVKAPGFVEQLFTVLRPLGFDLPTAGAFTSRFEFSRLPADGGGLLPHTDIPSKVVTIVLPMRGPNDAWQDAWGGGTAILRPRDPAATHRDYQADPAAFETVTTYPYAANQAVVFMKTAASWHSVTCGGTAGLWRKTVTINVERVL